MRRVSNRNWLLLLILGLAVLSLPLSARAQWNSGADSAFGLHYNGPSSTSTYHTPYRSNYNAQRARINEERAEQRAQAAIAKQRREAALKLAEEQREQQAAAEAAEERRQAAMNQADNLFQQGRSAAQAGEYVVAIDDYREAIQAWPDRQNSSFIAAINEALADLHELSIDHAYAARALQDVNNGKQSLNAPTIDMAIDSPAPGDNLSRRSRTGLNSSGIDMAIASPPSGEEAYQPRNSPTEAPTANAVEPTKPLSPATARAYKGWEALQAHDWKLAYAWYQDALARDPNNAALQIMTHFTRFAATSEPDPISRGDGGSGIYRSETPAPDAEMLELMDEWAKFHPDLVPPHRSKSVPVSTQAAIQSQRQP